MAARLAIPLSKWRSDRNPVVQQSTRDRVVTAGWFQRDSDQPRQPSSGRESAGGESELRMLQSADDAGVQSRRLQRSGAGPVGDFRALPEQPSLAAAAGRVDEFRPELPLRS